LASALESSLKAAFICRSENLQDNGPMKAAPNWSMRALPGVLLVLALVLSSGAAQAQGKGHDDHERAQAAVLAGQVLPLHTLLERVARLHPGQVLEVELERDHGRWIYEIKNLQADGQLVKLELDARTGEVMSKRARAR
jgi:uncharacterized membrane protein YkoI